MAAAFLYTSVAFCVLRHWRKQAAIELGLHIFPSASCYVPQVPNKVLRLYSHSLAADLKRGFCPENLWKEDFRKLPTKWQIFLYTNYIS